MTAGNYTHGLHELGAGLYAYLQPDGSWGLNNAGLIVSERQALLVDTLYDLELTGAMLEAIRRAEPLARIEYLVNTHANGDHTFGNQLVAGAEIIASEACADEFNAVTPQLMAGMVQSAPELGLLGRFVSHCFGRYHFQGITLTRPTRVFSGRLDLKIGEHDVHLIEVGPLHTRGDVMVHVPTARTLFAGDVLFIGGTPIMWTGPVNNWIKALDLILSMDVTMIVPGHGPLTDKSGVAEIKSYWEYTTAEARKRFDAGMPAFDAAREMLSGRYGHWTDPERVAINVEALYREFRGESQPANVMELFTEMAGLLEKLQRA